jgi:hypothetical protein
VRKNTERKYNPAKSDPDIKCCFLMAIFDAEKGNVRSKKSIGFFCPDANSKPG